MRHALRRYGFRVSWTEQQKRPPNTGFDLPQLMLALAQTAGHSERSLTTTYETITYLLHCSPSRSWLVNVVMRQQDRIDDDQQHERDGHEKVEHDRIHEEVDD